MSDKPRRRILNIIRRMSEGDDFYTNCSPRITRAEIEEIKALGFALQIEHTHGAQPGPIAVYPLKNKEFLKQAKRIFEEVSKDES